ncbi:MAG: putative lipid II flippase FtsW [Verrucomicrobia bacterium]|nr:putative lipid II flippase FtsW [Verrucomicrobiota bacterium]
MKTATIALAFCVAALLALGMVMLYSASMVQAGGKFLMMQLVWGGAGLVVCFAVAAMDYQWLKKSPWIPWGLFALSVLLLVLVLVPGIGLKINGARRWLDLRLMRFQPSELAKIALIIALAYYADFHRRKMANFREGIFYPAIFIGLTLGLTIIEPDFGTTALLGSVCGVMLMVAGVRWHYILSAVVLGISAISVMVWLNPNRLGRMMAYLHPEEHKSGVGFQAYQAMLALGSGGWTGLGLGNGRQKLGFVPEHHTDFIFSIIGEELGLVATLAVVIAFIVIVVCGVFIAWNARDTFGQLLATGITFLIGLQAFINLGVVTSALPNKGLPLPFISYGGSNLLAMLACVGLLFSIARKAAPEMAVEGGELDFNRPLVPVPTH